VNTRRQFIGKLAAAAAIPPFAAFAAVDPDVAKAMKAVQVAIPLAESDPQRPVYHFRPPAQWNNDPNGTIFYKGWHHLFYQHNPYKAEWGSMHWGHARSRDLVNWEHLPIALWPSLEKGEQHVFSGSAILGPDGRPRILYTSIGKRDPEQWMAIPADDDLISWEKYPQNPVATTKLHGARRVLDWRDPFLFREAGEVYMVCGGNGSGWGRSGSAAVQLYRAAAEDLSAWKYLGPVFEYRDRQYTNIECPNLFKLGSKWVLLMSPHKPTEYFVGDLDFSRPGFVPEMHGLLDPGASYASNVSFDDQGRCILWLWGQTGTDPVKGWNSVMTLPRILSIDSEGALRQNPAPEFEKLRGALRMSSPAPLEGKAVPLDGISGDCLEIEAEFDVGRATGVGLRLRCSAAGRAGAVVKYHTDGTGPYANGGTFAIGTAGAVLGRQRNVRMRVFLDKRVIEAYVNDGAVAIFSVVDAGPEDLGVEAFASGGTARLVSLKAWPLKPAAFSLERFRI
jgi:beta-fructofuranosidase